MVKSTTSLTIRQLVGHWLLWLAVACTSLGLCVVCNGKLKHYRVLMAWIHYRTLFAFASSEQSPVRLSSRRSLSLSKGDCERVSGSRPQNSS